MISAEVPVMLSKALEMFITELSLRAWLQTEESKRRTVQVGSHCLPCGHDTPHVARIFPTLSLSLSLSLQRSDIAMAITKNDMFDFLIDIVPREEIQLRSKTQKVTTNKHSSCFTAQL